MTWFPWLFALLLIKLLMNWIYYKYNIFFYFLVYLNQNYLVVLSCSKTTLTEAWFKKTFSRITPDHPLLWGIFKTPRKERALPYEMPRALLKLKTTLVLLSSIIFYNHLQLYNRSGVFSSLMKSPQHVLIVTVIL